MFDELMKRIKECSSISFHKACKELDEFVSSSTDFDKILAQIGTIPEAIKHDSTEEKLFSKVSDAVLARVFRELGLKSTILSERGDSADVLAQSNFHEYTLVADAKAFRLSRTAKNQKDFKVASLSAWRKDAEYAVLCSPYFQYPRTQSQIFAQAVEDNVCLLSWEHMIFLLNHEVRESQSANLSSLWGFSDFMAQRTTVAEKKSSFLREFNRFCESVAGAETGAFDETLVVCIESIKSRGKVEKSYWEAERAEILSYSREQAISELIKNKKIEEKIRQINSYVGRLTHD